MDFTAAHLNPLTAPSCKISYLKDARKRLKKQYIFRSYNKSLFSAMRFDENLFTCQGEKVNKKAEGFRISHFYWSFRVALWQRRG